MFYACTLEVAHLEYRHAKERPKTGIEHKRRLTRMKLHRTFTVADKLEANNVHCLKSKRGYIVIAQVGRTVHKNRIKANGGSKLDFYAAKLEAKRFIRSNYNREGQSYM